jgi:hypothetical protein
MIGPASSSGTESGILRTHQLIELNDFGSSSAIPCGVSPIGEDVFLEGARRRQTRVQLLSAVKFIRAVGAEFATLARTHHPLDTGPVARLPQVLHVRVRENYFAGALVTSNTACGVGHLRTKGSPFVVQEGFVRGAKTGPINLDKDLSWIVNIVAATRNKPKTYLGRVLGGLRFV